VLTLKDQVEGFKLESALRAARVSVRVAASKKSRRRLVVGGW